MARATVLSPGSRFPLGVAALLAFAIALFASAAFAGRVHPDLEARLAALPPDDLVPVIVELEERVHPATAAAPHSSRRARGRAVVEALREVATRSQRPVRAFLDREQESGAVRDVKPFWVFNGMGLSARRGVIHSLAARSDVREVRFDRSIPAPVPRPTDASTASAEPVWNLLQIRAPEVWALGPGYTGAGVVVGSFDTGVDGTHPDLAPRYRGNHAISWFDPYGQHATPYDNNGHGTHTTGTMVGGDASGYAIGVAPGAQWIAAKAWRDNDQAFVSAFHQIFEWFLAPGGNPDHAPDVVNSSWGLDPPGCYTEFDADVQALRAAGIVPVFASGNAGPDPSTTLSPGNIAQAFSVGATDFFDEIAEFSSRGPSQCDGAVKPDISAPGVAILSSLPGGLHFELDGTSMAAPHIAGAAAVLRSVKPTLTVDEVEAALMDGSVDLGPPGPDNDFGVGRLDLFESTRIVLGLSVVGISATTPAAREAGTVPGTFTITRKGNVADPLTLTYTVGGTAVPGTDYVALPGSVTFAGGVASATIAVVPIDDPEVERDESVTVTIDAHPDYLLNPAQATVTVVSDEVPPDLVVSSLGAPTAAGAGDAITIADTTRNAGAAPAGSSVTAFFLSGNSTFEPGDVSLGTRSVPALAAGASDMASTGVTIPAGTAAGNHWLLAVADPGDLLVETLENNNVTARAIAIGPDLVVSGLSGPSDAGAGLPITLSVTTRNQGAGAANAATTSFYLSTDAVLDGSDVLLASRAVAPLAPGASDTGPATGTVPAGTAPGSYYLFARADSGEVVAEVFETNNSVYGGSVRIGPDLIVPALTVPTAAGAGSTFSVTDTTRNAGGGTAGATTTRLYLSANSVLDAGDTPLAARAVGALAPGASDTGSVSVTIPAGTAAGTYYLIANADGDAVVGESQEGNNAAARSITIGADLVVSALTGPTDGGAGLAITLTVTTRNQGAGTAAASTTSLHLSADAAFDASDALLGNRAVPALASGGSDTGPATVTIPSGTASGTYYLFARADADGVVAETSETNNATPWILRVGPDLVVSSFTAPTAAGAGAVIAVSDTTRNSGGGAAAASTTRFYLSNDTLLDAGDVPLASRAVAALAAGTSHTGSLNVAIPAATAAGTYYLIAGADADAAVGESQEGNNLLARAITIGSDLMISSFTVPVDSGAGSAITLTDTTRNQGAAPSGASTTSYYLSADAILDGADVALGSRAVPALGPGALSTGSASVTVPAGTAAGTYYVFARADALEAVVETFETNNTVYSAMRVGPDLVISALNTPATTGAGSPITVTDTTRNSGGGAAGATTTRFYLSANPLLDAGDVMLGSRAVASLAAGASSTGSASVTIPAGTAAGTYWILAMADADGAQAESQEANNVLSRSITIGADLVISAFTAPADSGAGNTITVTDTTRNAGASPAGDSVTAYYLSANTILDAADTSLGSRAVPPLAPGATSSGTATLTIPAGTAAGTYYLFVRADALETVVETAETNNTTYWTLRVGPDLTVTSLTAPPAAEAGSAITVTDTTRNSGGGAAGASSTRIHLSTNPFLDALDVPLGSRAVAPLAAGASEAGSVSVTIPAGTAAGTYYLIASADAESAVVESQEGNNAYARSITIGADLVLSGVTAPADSGAGSTIAVTDTTRNQGAAAAGASTTTFYLSTDAMLDAADAVLGSRSVPALGAGATSTSSTSVTVPAGTAPGTYYLFARADSGNAVSETMETNNTLYGGSMRVGPDLLVTSLAAAASAGAGSAVTLGDTTRNSGGGAAGATTTRFYLSTNTILDASDVFLGERAVAALGPATSEAGTLAVTIPAGTAPGTWYLIAEADSGAAVAEVTETNNRTYRSIQVTVP